MITSLTCALVTAAVLSMMFRSTRAIGIICEPYSPSFIRSLR